MKPSIRLQIATAGLAALAAVAAVPTARAQDKSPGEIHRDEITSTPDDSGSVVVKPDATTAAPETPGPRAGNDHGSAQHEERHEDEAADHTDERRDTRTRDEDRRDDRRQRRDGIHSVIHADGLSRRNVEDGPGDRVPTSPPTRERGDLSNPIGRISDVLRGPIDNGVYAVATCQDGAVRTPNPSQTSPVTWVLPEPIPPKVEIASQSGHGSYAEDGAERAFEPYTWMSNLPPLPGPAGAAGRAGKVVGVGAKVGDAGAKAAKRWADDNANKMVDLRVSIYKMQVDVQCTAVEVCKGGAWLPAGMSPVSEERKPLMPPIRYHKNGIQGSEVPRHVRKATNKAKPLQIALAQYQADPCTGAATPGTGGAGGGGGVKTATGGAAGGGKDCRPIKIEHEAVLKQLKVVTNQHAEAHLPILDLEVELAKVDLDWANAKKAAQQRLAAAKTEQKNAQAYYDGLVQNAPPLDDAAANRRWRTALDRAVTRVRAADAAVTQAQADLAKVDGEFQAKRSAVEAKLAAARAELARLAAEKARLEKLEAETLGRYLDCLAGA